MGDWTLGSVCDLILSRSSGYSDSLSGTCISSAEVERIDIQSYTGQAIGSPTFSEKFAPAIIAATTASMVELQCLEGGDFQEVKIMDYTIKKGQGGNLDKVSQKARADAERKKKTIGRNMLGRRIIG